MTRKSVPRTVRFGVLLEAAYRCGNPRCRQTLTLDLHHIEAVREGGGNEAENLIALCPTCHAQFERGYIEKDAVIAWKGLLVSLNNPHRGSADLLLVLREEERRLEEEGDEAAPAFRFTGDGLGSLAGLITSKLLEIDRRFLGASMWGSTLPSFTVRLTERGRGLVDAWLEGSSSEVEAVLEHSIVGDVNLRLRPQAEMEYSADDSASPATEGESG